MIYGKEDRKGGATVPISSARYIDRWRLTGSLQPFRAEDVRMYGFVFRADPARLAALAAYYLARPVQGLVDYPPSDWLPFVLLTFTHTGKLFSTHRPYRNIGWTSETEAALWLFAPDPERSRIVWFTPYAFVDLSLGVLHGREIYGTARDIGWFGFPGSDQPFPRHTDEPEGFALEAFGTPVFGPEAEWRRYPLLSVRRNAHVHPLAAEWSTYVDASRVLLGQLAHPAVSSWVDTLWHPHGTSIFLKQVYDASDSSRASYQALIEATTRILEPPDAPLGWFRRGGLLHGRYALELADSDTHPIARDLGLLVGKQPAEFGYWLDFDFELEAGKEVWRADESSTTPTVTAGGARYVDRWAFTASPQPFVADDVRMYGFAFSADADKLQRLCDRYLNDPFDGSVTFRAFGRCVMMTFTHIARMASQQPPYATCGTVSETEVAIWIPVRPEGSAGLPLLVWWAPYMLVDNPLAVTQGRELYGFPKEQGRFNQFRNVGDHPAELSVRAQAVERFSLTPQPHAAWRELLSVTGTPQAAEQGGWTNHSDAVHHLNRSLARHQLLTPGDLGAVAGRAATLWPPHGTQLFLKQFPDVTDGSRACYQAVVRAESTVSGFRGGWFLGDDYTLTVHPCDSHPLFGDLGLATGARALLSYWLDFDFICDTGSEVLRAADRSATPAAHATGIHAVLATLRTSAAAILPQMDPVALLGANPLARWITSAPEERQQSTSRIVPTVPTLADPPAPGIAPAPPRRSRTKRRKH